MRGSKERVALSPRSGISASLQWVPDFLKAKSCVNKPAVFSIGDSDVASNMTGAMIPPQDLAFNPTPYTLADGGFYESDGSADIAGTLQSQESRRNCTAFCIDNNSG